MSISGINNYKNAYSYTKTYANKNKNKNKKEKENDNITENKKDTCDNNKNNYINNISNNDTLSETQTVSDENKFENINDLMSYISEKYEVVKKGMADISSSYLKDCLKDDKKLNELYNMLESADIALKDAKENIKGFQYMKVTIDKDGNMEYETSGSSVTFNEAKRARQLASAKTAAEIRVVLNLLNKDLSDCKNGVTNGMCDESEVAKVEAMLRKAQQRMGQISGNENTKNDDEISSFYINMLM